MKFRENSINKLYAFALAAVFTLTLAGCGGGGGGSTTTDPDPTPMPDPAIAQRAAIKSAIDMASTAVAAVDNDSSDADVTAADTALAAARGAITAATDVPAEEKTANTGTVDALETVLASAKMARMAAMEEMERMEQEAMVATAAKLFAGITAFNDQGGQSPAAAERFVRWSGDNLQVGDGSAGTILAPLEEDENTQVGMLHGWQGKRYTLAADDDANANDDAGSYEAIVYGNVDEPTEGKKFGGDQADDEFEYALTSNVTDPAATTQNGELTIDTTAPATPPSRVALSGVTRTAGTETFKFSETEITDRRIDVPGSFHGVPGTFYCTPTTRADGCTAAVAAKGFTLAGGTWAFKPTDPNTRLMETPDANYATFGWWLRTKPDGSLSASAFHQDRGTAPAAVDISGLNGTATYVGGAAGKYAIAPATGGMHDAGHFTATATLTAKFGNADDGSENNRLSGVIDNFTGGDGESRNWKVTLNEEQMTNPGAQTATSENTVWSIGGEAAAKSGSWAAQLKEGGDDGVPELVTGVFQANYGNSGNMVGGFGANKQ